MSHPGSTWTLRRSALQALLLAAALLATPALAQPTPAEIETTKKTAVEIANKAYQAYSAGKYADAIAGFASAEKVFHAPTFLLYMARAQAKTGKLLAARATYESIVKEQFPPYAPAEFFQAQASAKKDLADLEPRIPRLQIQAGAGITAATLDGKPAEIGRTVEVDPGEHKITGAGDSVSEVTETVTLQEKDTRTITLETGAAAADTAAPATASLFRRIPTASYIAFGAGGLGLLTAVLFGSLTLAKKAEYDAKPTLPTAEQGEAFALATDIGLGIAAAGAAVGAAIWILAPARAKPAPAVQSLVVAPRGAGLSLTLTY